MAIGRKLEAGGLVRNDHVSMIGIMDVPSSLGVGRHLLGALSDQNINVELIAHLVDLKEKDHIVLCVDRDDLDRAVAVAEIVRDQVGGKTVSDREMALVSLFTPDSCKRPGVASRIFAALGERDIPIRGVSTSLSTVACLIKMHHLEDAVQALRAAFTLP